MCHRLHRTQLHRWASLTYKPAELVWSPVRVWTVDERFLSHFRSWAFKASCRFLHDCLVGSILRDGWLQQKLLHIIHHLVVVTRESNLLWPFTQIKVAHFSQRFHEVLQWSKEPGRHFQQLWLRKCLMASGCRHPCWSPESQIFQQDEESAWMLVHYLACRSQGWGQTSTCCCMSALGKCRHNTSDCRPCPWNDPNGTAKSELGLMLPLS